MVIYMFYSYSFEALSALFSFKSEFYRQALLLGFQKNQILHALFNCINQRKEIGNHTVYVL